MVFYFAVLLSRIKGVLFLPLKTWKTIGTESGYSIETLIFLFISCLCAGLASLIKSSVWIQEFFIPFFSVLTSSVLIRFFKPIRKADWENSFNLTVYSFFPLIWCYSLSFIFGFQQFLLPFGLLHSLTLLFISVKTVLKTGFFQTLVLIFKITFMVFCCLYIMMVFFSGNNIPA
ncbi:MAG: hypothetical protein LBG92_07375 [Prevotellaceae bacterium]|nr:hypothetical protein [Prevotellaceae bacterium]